MPSLYRPRRPRASPLWQIVHYAWNEFLAEYETAHRKNCGPLRPDTVHVVVKFYRCGDLSAGFTRLQCPDCGHEKLLAFSCNGRHFCPSCHKRRVRQTGHWIAHTLCHNVPHRQFVFTMPRPLRGIFSRCGGTITCCTSYSRPPSNPCATGSAPASTSPMANSPPSPQSKSRHRAPFSLEKITWVEKTNE